MDTSLGFIEVSGVGYNVLMPSSSISMLPGIGNIVKIYTYLSVREDAMQLYGFNTILLCSNSEVIIFGLILIKHIFSFL